MCRANFKYRQNSEADFACDFQSPPKVHADAVFPVTVTVQNDGNLLDVAEVKLYGDTLLATRRFEIAPGETRVYTFNVALSKTGPQTLTAILGQTAISHPIRVSKPVAESQPKPAEAQGIPRGWP